MSDEPPQFSCYRDFTSRPGHYQAAVDQQHLAIRNCFAGKAMFCADLDAQHVARQIEPADLTASVGALLASPHRTALNFVEVIDRLALAIYLHVAWEAH